MPTIAGNGALRQKCYPRSAFSHRNRAIRLPPRELVGEGFGVVKPLHTEEAETRPLLLLPPTQQFSGSKIATLEGVDAPDMSDTRTLQKEKKISFKSHPSVCPQHPAAVALLSARQQTTLSTFNKEVGEEAWTVGQSHLSVCTTQSVGSPRVPA